MEALTAFHTGVHLTLILLQAAALLWLLALLLSILAWTGWGIARLSRHVLPRRGGRIELKEFGPGTGLRSTPARNARSMLSRGGVEPHRARAIGTRFRADP